MALRLYWPENNKLALVNLVSQSKLEYLSHSILENIFCIFSNSRLLNKYHCNQVIHSFIYSFGKSSSYIDVFMVPPRPNLTSSLEEEKNTGIGHSKPQLISKLLHWFKTCRNLISAESLTPLVHFQKPAQYRRKKNNISSKGVYFLCFVVYW